MKNTLSKTIGAALAVFMSAVLAPTWVSAQADNNTEALNLPVHV